MQGQRKGFRHTEETKKRISEALKKNPPIHAFKPGCKPPPHAFRPGEPSMHKGKKFPHWKVKKGPNHPNFKGAKIESGYFWIYTPGHMRARRNYVKRSDLIMEKVIGRPLTKVEVVHHKNRNRLDDSESNLQLVANRSEHMRIHRNTNLRSP